jgi:hypothetical protein
MDTLLLGITVVSLIVAFVMSVTVWKLTREEKQRSAARIAALSAAAFDDVAAAAPPSTDLPVVEKPIAKAPWKPAPFDWTETAEPAAPVSLRVDAAKNAASTHAMGFLGAAPQDTDSGNRQKTLAIAAAILFVILAGGTAWVMSAPEGTSAVAVGPNSPLELVSLSHARQNEKLQVSGLVRNPAAGQPVERLSAVVFLFDRTGTFVTSSRAHVDFLRLAAGDESPFVVSLDAPPTVARYRVSFRTDDGVVPHIDRRGDAQAAPTDQQPVNVTLK